MGQIWGLLTLVTLPELNSTPFDEDKFSDRSPITALGQPNRHQESNQHGCCELGLSLLRWCNRERRIQQCG